MNKEIDFEEAKGKRFKKFVSSDEDSQAVFQWEDGTFTAVWVKQLREGDTKIVEGGLCSTSFPEKALAEYGILTEEELRES